MAWAKPHDASMEAEGVESVRARAPSHPDQRSLWIRVAGKARHSWDKVLSDPTLSSCIYLIEVMASWLLGLLAKIKWGSYHPITKKQHREPQQDGTVPFS